jgi:hypothetical protein
MTAPKSVTAASFLREQLDSASPDLLREMVKTFADALMSAEADALCGAPYGTRSDERGTPVMVTGQGNGILGQARWSWRSRSCGKGPISRTGCYNTGAAPRRAVAPLRTYGLPPRSDHCLRCNRA